MLHQDPWNDSTAMAPLVPGSNPATDDATMLPVVPLQEGIMRLDPPRAEPTDRDLMRSVVAQEAAALQMLYERYFRRAFALAYRMLNDATAAEDCVQDVFLKVWQKPELYNAERGAFSSWLLTVIHHRAANDLRSRRRLAPLPTPFYEQGEEGNGEETLADPGAPIEDQLVIKEDRERVRVALADLSPAQRQVLELAYYGGMTQSEIALHLSQPLGTVKTRVRNGLQKMRTAMESSSP